MWPWNEHQRGNDQNKARRMSPSESNCQAAKNSSDEAGGQRQRQQIEMASAQLLPG